MLPQSEPHLALPQRANSKPMKRNVTSCAGAATDTRDGVRGQLRMRSASGKTAAMA